MLMQICVMFCIIAYYLLVNDCYMGLFLTTEVKIYS